ncbi:MAG TPA: hypothetical protein VMS88_03770 [Terriglobales bacterium]|nr:hypothetical protein [Terriglobales bacterium]
MKRALAGEDAPRTAQAWVALNAVDPQVASALTVARSALAAGRGLAELRRWRLFELRGPLPDRARLEEMLHRSIRFYNPNKERCIVRGADEPAPLAGAERAVLVVDRGGARRTAAERWWLHETGERIEVREAVVWALRFKPGIDAAAGAAELTILRGMDSGLFCNLQAQDHRQSGADVPLPWIARGRRTGGRRA